MSLNYIHLYDTNMQLTEVHTTMAAVIVLLFYLTYNLSFYVSQVRVTSYFGNVAVVITSVTNCTHSGMVSCLDCISGRTQTSQMYRSSKLDAFANKYNMFSFPVFKLQLR